MDGRGKTYGRWKARCRPRRPSPQLRLADPATGRLKRLWRNCLSRSLLGDVQTRRGLDGPDRGSPGRADTAQVKVPCSGRNPNSAGCVGQSPSPALAWTFPRTAMRSFVILKGDPAGRADFGVKHRAAWASRPSPRLPDSVTAKCASSADVTLARDGPTHRRRRPGASCDGWMRCFPVEPPCATAFGDTAA